MNQARVSKISDEQRKRHKIYLVMLTTPIHPSSQSQEHKNSVTAKSQPRYLMIQEENFQDKIRKLFSFLNTRTGLAVPSK